MKSCITTPLFHTCQRFLAIVLLLSFGMAAHAQTFKYKSSEGSALRTGAQLHSHGLPDTMKVWCNEWNAIAASPSGWGSNFKLKSNHSFVKFYVDNYYPRTQHPYTYQLVYQIFGYTNPSDTTIYTVTSDTLTISGQNNADPLGAYQDIGLAKFSKYYKTMVVVNAIMDYNGGSPISADLSDTTRLNFAVESSILTQKYDKSNYGSGSSLEMSQTADPANNYLLVSFNLPGGSTPVQLTPVNFELEWTYIDDYKRDPSTGTITSASLSDLAYEFTNNATRVWLDSSHYRIPLVYPSGYLAYRVRMVRPDSSLFKYPIYSDWSYSIADSGSLSSLNSAHPEVVYHISDAHMHDSLNWQYTVSFAEGGKYKHILNYYDGLLKSRENITRFNSRLDKLIVTKSIYDYEGRPAIRTIPAPVPSTSFSFLHNVDINSITGLPYRASDFDTGWHVCPGDPVLSPMATTALANIYYSNQNTDTAGVQRFVPDAGGYPMVQTIFSPAFNDRVEKQGGAGPRLQIADSNVISNFYVSTGQQVMNRLFGLDAGWNSYYNMTVSKDPNMQLSMSIKNYEGKQVASSMIGEGGNPATHAIDPLNAPGVTYNQEDILYGYPQAVIGNSRICDKDFFNEVEGNDSIRYEYQFSPYPVCPGQYLCVAAKYAYHVMDQCGDTVFADDSTLGYTGVVSSPVSFTGTSGIMHLGVAPYSVHKELTIDPADVDAAIDSFLKVANCLHDEPWFVRKSVERNIFPCPGTVTTDPCEIKRLQMIKDMYPGGTYGGYSVDDDGSITASWPSIFVWHDGGPTPEMPDAPGYPHYHYQDSCLEVRLPDTITIGGIDYYPLRSMSLDSFIMVYNLSIAAGDNSIAEALLPLHPEYCLLKACISDTFKTYLQSLPNEIVAEKLNLLYLDSIIAQDPIVPILGGGTIIDSLSTYPGGMVRLDLPELIRAYCGCSDTVMMRECVSHVFSYEIANRLLINDVVKKTYFADMVNLYLTNRQRYINAYVMAGAGDSCRQCDSSRLPIVTGSEVFGTPMITSWGAPSTAMLDSPWTSGGTIAHWLLETLADGSGSYDSTTLAEIADSAALLYSSADSAWCYGQLDTIMARLGNCASGDPVVLAAIRNTLDSLCAAHVVGMGSFTAEMIRYALVSNGVSPDDICNQYLVDATTPEPSAAGSEGCMNDSFYIYMANYLNKPTVNGALVSPGTYYHDTLAYLSNGFENDLYEKLGSHPEIMERCLYDASSATYTLYLFNDPALSLPGSDTVRLYLRSTAGGACAAIFAAGATGDSVVVNSVSCVNTLPASSISGLINEYAFVTQVTAYADTTYNTCVLIGWTDTIETMVPSDNQLKGCIPCTQMRDLYTKFLDTMATLGVKGMDHPLIGTMLVNFMNQQLPNDYSLDQYEKFIQSCSLADSMLLPLYVGYSNLTFANTTDADAFISMLNSIDAECSFNDIYRDSSASGVTLCVDFTLPPVGNLHTYRSAIAAYAGSYSAKVVNGRLDSLQADSVMGFIYAYPGTTIPSAATIFGAGGSVTISGPETRGIWMGTHYEPQDFYYVKYAPGVTPPYEVSKDGYELVRYFWNNGLGATYVSNFMSTVNKDYFNPRKSEYLSYAYHYQQLPPYTVLDSLQANYITTRIPGYAGSEATYVDPLNPTQITNLFLADGGSINRYFDTLLNMIYMVRDLNTVNPAHIFFDTNKVVVTPTIDSPLIAYRCSDGRYWYRYFGNGDTMYNAYVEMPAWIPRYQHPHYSIVSIGPPSGIVPALGDSTTRYFTLNLHHDGDTEIIQARGMMNYAIGRNTVLKDVLMGNPITSHSSSSPLDTFDNCERQLLNSAVRQGVVDYNNYMDSLVRSVRAGFTDYMLTHVQEKLIIGYQTQQFGYTLYYYDRAGNLTETVPPEGVHTLGSSLLNIVDTVRMGASLSTTLPAGTSLTPAHTKVSSYNYNSINQIVDQKTPDGGETRFYYDAAGRLLFSQNAKQNPDGYCTYNLYDKQNRIIETGEAKLLCPYFDEYETDLSPFMPDCFFAYPGSNPLLSTSIISSISPVMKRIKEMPHDSVILYIHSIDRRDVVVTVYDTQATNLYTLEGMNAQENLRKRIAATKYFRSLSALDTYFRHYDYATHYSYDIAGNVKTLVQDYPALSYLKQRYKRVDYDYDLISGKVNMLSYNRSFSDQYYQRYSYDDDNRILKVETSGDGVIWHRDAEYEYYEHGPLARVDIGDLRVQGIDYAYTVQGWLKMMNGDTLNAALEMGGDGDATVNAKDAAYFSIDYFNNDYKPITAYEASHVAPVTRNLYNGNIARQTMAMADFARLNRQYVYDQLNRIYTANYASVNPVDHSLAGLPDYRNNYSYDGDGNLKTLVRYGNNTGSGAALMDSFSYTYGGMVGGYTPNQLKKLDELAPDVYTNDIHAIAPSAPPNYLYDRVGNTIKDVVSGQDTIQWNLYNKVTQTRNSAANNWMHFDYDAAGNRVGKYFTQGITGGSEDNNEYYVRDAQGNILAIYHENALYKMEPYGWVSAFHEMDASLGITEYQYAHDWAAPYFAHYEPFVAEAMRISQEDSAFTVWMLDKPVSYFLSNSSKVYTDIMSGNAAYVPSVVQYDRDGNDSIMATALVNAADDDPANLTQAISILLTDSAIAAHTAGLMCQAGADSLLSYAMGYAAQDSFVVCDTALAYLYPQLGTIAANPQLSNGLAQQVTAAAGRYPQQYAAFLQLLATDSVIYDHPQFGNVQGQYVAQMQNTLADYAEKSHMYTFFDQYAGAEQLLDNVAGDEDLLRVCLAADAGGYLYSMDSVMGGDRIDSSIIKVGDIAPRPYAEMIELGLGGSIGMGDEDMSTAVLETLHEVMKQHSFGLAEHDIYGSARLGVRNYWPGQAELKWDFEHNLFDTTSFYARHAWYSNEYQDIIQDTARDLYGHTHIDKMLASHITGQKQYELTDHLGNVLATVSDARRPNDTTVCDTIAYYLAAVKSAYDYYPFGMYMPGRYTNDTATHCTDVTATVMVPVVTSVYHPFDYYSGTISIHSGTGVLSAGGSGGVVHSTDISATGNFTDVFQFTTEPLMPNVEQDLHIAIAARTGKFLLMLVDTVTNNTIATLQLAASANPDTVTFHFTPTAERLTVMGGPLTGGESTIELAGYYTYTVTTVPHTVVTSVCSNDEYRYGFNTQLKTNEWCGVGNHTTALYWEYDTRTGRRANIDPKFKKFLGISPYSSNSDNPIQKADPKGDEGVLAIIGAAVGAGISLGKSVHDGGWKALKDGKTWAHAGVAATQGFIIGITNGGSLLLNAGLSSGSSIIDDAIDGKLKTKKDWEASLLKAGTKGVLSYALGAAFKPFDNALESVGTVPPYQLTRPLMRVLQTKAMIINGGIDWGFDQTLDRLYNGWDEGRSYDDPESSNGKGFEFVHHRGAIK